MYLREIFKDLLDRKECDKKLGISKLTFIDYMKMPLLISEKLFTAFDKNLDGYLNLSEFSEGLCNLYMGSFEETLKIIFELCDFDKDGKISGGDVKLLLSYLPLKTEGENCYKYQMKSLDEIENIIKISFKGKKIIKLQRISRRNRINCFRYIFPFDRVFL